MCVFRLDTVLEIPWKYKFHTAKVMADYGSADNNLLPIFKDQHIVVVSKEGDATGWWKGRFGDLVKSFASQLRYSSNSVETCIEFRSCECCRRAIFQKSTSKKITSTEAELQSGKSSQYSRYRHRMDLKF